MFSHSFMITAFWAAFVVSVMIPLMGTVIVLRRMSNIGEALSHTSLAGVALGLILGWNPTVTSILVCVLASIIIELIRRFFPKYAEISVNIILAAGIGLAAVLSGFTGNSSNFNAYLFGSVVAVSDTELLVITILGIVVVLFSVFFYRAIFSITFDEENAHLLHLPINGLNFAFAILTAIVVAVASKTVGALIVTSLIVLPVAAAMMVSKSYKSSMILSVLFAVAFSMGGLTLSYYMDLKPGGTMALLGVITVLVLLPFSRRKSR